MTARDAPITKAQGTTTSTTTSRIMMLITCLLIHFCAGVHGFVPLQSPKSAPLLFLARKNNNNNQSKKKKNNKNKNNDKKKIQTKKSSESTPMVSVPSTTSHAPPWKILSPKNAKKNVEREKRRREQGALLLEDDDDELKSLSKAFLQEADQILLKWKRFNPTRGLDLKFVGSYLEKRLPPKLGVPEVAFLGRSNVGKSALLNKLCGCNQARVGKTPGATASVNLYVLLKKQKKLLGLADLPGFGYAKLSKETKEAVQQAAERFLEKRNELALCILLVDIRRIPSKDDCAVLAALYDMGLPLLVVATKVDKISSSVDLERKLQQINEGLGLPEGQPLCVSAVTGFGTKQLWSIIMEACETRVEEIKGELAMESNPDEEESIALDNDGNPLLDDEVAYDQGYDWIHSDNSQGNVDLQEEKEEEEEEQDLSEWKMARNEQEQAEERDSLKLKNLKKKARNMERSGEI